MVEFALLGPLALFLIFSIVVVAIIVTNYVQLTNVARDGARVAAICGSVPSAVMPDGSGATCSDANVKSYVTNHLVAVPAGSVSPQIFVCTAQDVSNGTCNSSSRSSITYCQPGALVEIDMYYDQPLYMPFFNAFFGSNGTMRLNASAQATCEQ